MRRTILIAIAALSITAASAQVNTLSYNKPLAHLNPAIQNYDTEKGVLSISGLVSPLTQEEVPLAYIGIFEYKINDDFRVGAYSSSMENRLVAKTSNMVYASYRLPLDNGNYFTIGVDVGLFSLGTKSPEFNKVLAPNRFSFGEDSVAIGDARALDVGLGLAYAYNGFIGAIDFSKITSPKAYPFPQAEFESNTSKNLKDTAINVALDEVPAEVSINLIYNWYATKKLNFTHSFHMNGVGTGGNNFISFQNFVEINDRHSLGLGVYNNGNLGYVASAGVGFTNNIKLEVNAFIGDDFNYDEQAKLYKTAGLVPSFEANLRVEF
jgi:hypothetical protein